MYKKILVVTDNVREQTNGVVTTFRNLEGLAIQQASDLDRSQVREHGQVWT